MYDSERKKVLIDTDAGLDDILALLYLSAHQKVNLLAITLIKGVSTLESEMDNAARILTALKKKYVPIFLSGTKNLSGLDLKCDERYGKDGCAGVSWSFVKKKMGFRSDMCSAQAILHYVRKYRKELHIVCLGPLTNLALAYLLDNTLFNNVGSLTIRAGDLSPTTFRNVTEFAEFNAWCDPMGMKIVMNNLEKSSAPVALLDYTFCYNNQLPQEIFERMTSIIVKRGVSNIYCNFFFTVTDKRNEIIAKNYSENGYFACDLLAAIYVTYPELFKTKKFKLQSVESSGPKIGHTHFQSNNHGTINVVTEMDTKQVMEIFMDVLLNTPNPEKSNDY